MEIVLDTMLVKLKRLPNQLWKLSITTQYDEPTQGWHTVTVGIDTLIELQNAIRNELTPQYPITEDLRKFFEYYNITFEKDGDIGEIKCQCGETWLSDHWDWCEGPLDLLHLFIFHYDVLTHIKEHVMKANENDSEAIQDMAQAQQGQSDK